MEETNWYVAISEFLASHSQESNNRDTSAIITALCRVLADTAEDLHAPEDKKLEAVMRLTAHAMGYDDVLVLLGQDAKPINRN